MRQRILFVMGIPIVALVLTSCATTKVQPITKVSGVSRPDRIVVRDFAVSAADIELDRGVSARIARNMSATSQSAKEIAVGRAVSAALTKVLVKRLNVAGIRAVAAGSAVAVSDRTVSLRGVFTTVDEGNRTARMTVGFGLGRTDLRTRGIVFQGTPPNEKQVGEFETIARSSIRPGILPAGAAGNVAVSAGSSVLSEKVLVAVEKDASRTAKKIAKRVKKYYGTNGWL